MLQKNLKDNISLIGWCNFKMADGAYIDTKKIGSMKRRLYLLILILLSIGCILLKIYQNLELKLK